MKSIAFVTTCKGRLHHIKQTLPLIIEQRPAEIVVTDYNCPDRVGDWVEAHYPQVQVVRVTDDPGFCLARARNLGARQCRSDWLVFIDGDVLVAPGWMDWMQQNLQDGQFYMAGRIDGVRDLETFGTIICPRAAFRASGGYDEAYRNWGGEDMDFYHGLGRLGLNRKDYPPQFVKAISHADEERLWFSSGRTPQQQIVVNQCYRAAKAHMIKAQDLKGGLPLDTRRQLLETTRRNVEQWFDRNDGEPLSIGYVLEQTGPAWLPEPYELSSQLVFTITIGIKK